LQLIQFKKNPGSFTYHLKFTDGTEGDVSTKQLRDNCPCASCSGEQVLLHEYKPLNKPKITEAGYKLEKAEPVGNYAIKLSWLDGHDTGIYTWNHLVYLLNQNKKSNKTDEL